MSGKLPGDDVEHLEAAYEAAGAEWDAGEDAEVWDRASVDALD